MFFLEKDSIKDIIIPRIFFEQLIPLSPPEMVRIYLYGYYLAQTETGEAISHKEIAEKLGTTVDKVYETWDFYESCGIINKHYSEEGVLEYSVEFVNFSYKEKNNKKQLSNQEMMLLAKNEEHKKMLDRIEEITGTFLTPEDIRKIENFLQEYNMQKALIVEAFSFCVQKKKSRTVRMALGVARTWYLDGIRTVEDLEIHNENKSDRYKEYKKVLSFLGEYRTPTKAEEELIDKWIDKYNFSIEIIEKACEKSVAIKSPNMTYIDGILTNWSKETEKLNISGVQREKEDPTIYRLELLKEIDYKGKMLTAEEMETLKSIYNSYSLSDAKLAVLRLKQLNIDINLKNLYKVLLNPTSDHIDDTKIKSNDGRINAQQMKNIIERKNNQKSKDSSAKDKEDKNNKLKQLINKKNKRWEADQQ